MKVKKLLILGILLIICWACSYLYQQNKSASLMVNQKIGVAYIRKVELFDRYSRHKVNFSLVSDNNLIDSGWTIRDDIDFDNLKNVEKKNVLVVFDSIDLKNKVLLMKEDDFNKFKIDIPDSLIRIGPILVVGGGR